MHSGEPDAAASSGHGRGEACSRSMSVSAEMVEGPGIAGQTFKACAAASLAYKKARSRLFLPGRRRIRTRLWLFRFSDVMPNGRPHGRFPAA